MKTFATTGAAAILLAAATATSAQAAPPAAAEVVATYADLAYAKYEDSLKAAQALDAAIDALVASPSEETLAAAVRHGSPPVCRTSNPRCSALAIPSLTHGRVA